jgi:hypothetical protein
MDFRKHPRDRNALAGVLTAQAIDRKCNFSMQFAASDGSGPIPRDADLCLKRVSGHVHHGRDHPMHRAPIAQQIDPEWQPDGKR